MKQLILRHHAEPDGNNPTITVTYQDPTFQQKSAGPFPFVLAFTEDDRKLLRWYLEEFLICPLAVYQEKARQAVERMETLGGELFDAVFKERTVYDLYQNVRATLSATRIVVQANTSSGIALPWELIRDPGMVYVAYQAHAFVRGEPNIMGVEAPPPQGSTLNILLAISRPDDEKDVAFQSVARHLLDAFENQSKRVNIEVLRPATFTELSKRLQAAETGHYHIFHFDGHGAFQEKPTGSTMLYDGDGIEGRLYFEDRLITGKDLGAALAAAKVPIVLLNACQSGMTDPNSELVSLGNELLRSGACGVVAMSYSVYVQTAAAFMKSLYERLRAGDDLAGAHKKAVAALKDTPQRKSALGTDETLQDWVVPVLFESVSVTPLAKSANGSDTSAEKTPEEFGVPDAPEYGFHGRDNVTLRLERVFQNNTVALLWGMAGVGKTTTVTAFARWLARTGGLEGPVFFFSFEHHKTLAAVIGEIGRAYRGMIQRNGYGEWELLSPERQRQCVLDLLTQIPCFVIFDNFEPVSGFPTGTPSVWTKAEQDELRAFLKELTRRKAASKVLITSRRDTEPLLPACPHIFLDGMPRHEALEMAGAILIRHGLAPAKIRELPKFDNLIKFLKGNPLSLQVILPLLADGTEPEALLARLQAGTVALPASATTEQGRDTSLTASLTYRLESLSGDDTARLSVVGLFQGFVNAGILAMLSRADVAPTEIRGLSADDWTRILSAAAEIGLMRVVGKGYFTVHPALPWFFHERLTATFGDRLPALEKLFASAYGEYGVWLFRTFQTNPQPVMGLLSAEESNLLQALTLARSQQQDGATSGILYGINRLWTTQGRWEEFERLLSGVEKEVQDSNTGEPQTGRDYLWRVCLGMRQEIAHYRRDFSTAETIHLRLKTHYQTNGDEKNVAVALHQLGRIAQERRDFAEAEKWNRESLVIEQRIGNEHGTAGTLHQLGRIAQERRDFAEAEKWFRESLAIKQRIGDEYGTAGTLHQLGIIAEERRDFAEAEKWYRQSLEIEKRIGDEQGTVMTLGQLGNLAVLQRQFDKAEANYRNALPIFQRIGNEQGTAITLYQLGIIAEERRDFAEAEKWYRQAESIYLRANDPHSLAIVQRSLARLTAARQAGETPQTDTKG